MTSRLIRPSSGRRRLPALLVALWIGACTSAGAWAGDGHPWRGGARGPMMHGGPFAARGMRQERAPARAGAREAGPPVQAAPLPIERPPEAAPVDRRGRPGRLTPEERRALRQQINDAGRDIYRAPRP